MGMPVAVGHYIYADIDREVTQQAWQDWLARIHA
jgi:Fe-S cluster biosynthesis and repair protein YggX